MFRGHDPMRARRNSRPGLTRPSYTHAFGNDENRASQSRTHRFHAHVDSASQSREHSRDETDRTPLLSSTHRNGGAIGHANEHRNDTPQGLHRRRNSGGTSRSSHLRRPQPAHNLSSNYDVNNPPSIPGSPQLGADGYGDPMLPASFSSRSPKERRATVSAPDDLLIDIDQPAIPHERSPSSSRGHSPEHHRRRTHPTAAAEEDVCYPGEDMSAIAEEEDFEVQDRGSVLPSGGRRKRYRHWPDYSVLDEWSYEEKEQRSEGIRTKKISEPVLVGGRLRPQKHGWHREEEDAPYRFTYFNEELESTIHSQTISELLQQGQGFQDLFCPPQPELSDDSSDEDDYDDKSQARGSPANTRDTLSPSGQSKAGTRQSSVKGDPESKSRHASGDATPVPHNEGQQNGSTPKARDKRYGPRPTFWLDVLSPTDQEMRVLSKAFGIHALTAEDIMTQEAREKVELFRNYYFVNYRTFEQDATSEDYLEEVNMYIVVFREGIISFHFSMCPHPANVRRRIRQLKDYIIVSSDWISYALIDDVTDAYAPHIQSIEADVDGIDDEILELLTADANPQAKEMEKKERGEKDDGSSISGDDAKSGGGDMLRRIGEVRKKVMKFYRLIGNKADVVKGFAKRCNEYWEVAPRSEIGLYLGDIQDHVLTMTSSLSHYETLLSRAHSNYLAQINIKMNERQEQTADVLGKLTVLGTIVLPMNIITGMWGMNVLVPGQDTDNLRWFWSSKSILGLNACGSSANLF